jgi:hypothetical protein
MRYVLISRHTNGAEVPASEQERNLQEMGEWLAKLRPEVALPIRGGTSVTVKGTADYRGDIGGIVIFEAESLENAIALAKQSPGLKFGFTHEVFPEISMNRAAQQKVTCA